MRARNIAVVAYPRIASHAHHSRKTHARCNALGSFRLHYRSSPIRTASAWYPCDGRMTYSVVSHRNNYPTLNDAARLAPEPRRCVWCLPGKALTELINVGQQHPLAIWRLRLYSYSYPHEVAGPPYSRRACALDHARHRPRAHLLVIAVLDQPFDASSGSSTVKLRSASSVIWRESHSAVGGAVTRGCAQST